MNGVRTFFRNQQGATSVEYALLALLVALAVIVCATALGVNLGAAYAHVASKVPAIPSS